eukprot:TRINITY_DN4860_c0_g1_i1.p1 TRINITY_DN4860_c0_g1~~TRINITY_DN4860_c0_g1_i1.p1  ORF type:complete len:1029 (+),score=404.91 TRINITY_DN4860_c0_g1_i1:138-3224(+)
MTSFREHSRPGAPPGITQIELSIACRGLRQSTQTARITLPRIIVVAFKFDALKQVWTEAGRTEVERFADDVVFERPIVANYAFCVAQRFVLIAMAIEKQLDVANVHDQELLLECGELVGMVDTTLGDMVKGRFERDIKNRGRRAGVMRVGCAEVQEPERRVVCTLSVDKMDKKRDVFFVIQRANSKTGNYDTVYCSEVIKKSSKPRFKQVDIGLNELCRGDPQAPIAIEVWDSSSGKEVLIGICDTNLHQLRTRRELGIVDQDKASKHKWYTNSGYLLIRGYAEFSLPTFIDFVSSGTDLITALAIDFTATNKDPRNPASLHNFVGKKPGTGNEYATVMRTLLDVLQPYDPQHFIPTYGFGGKKLGADEPSEIFAVNGTDEYPECEGLEDVMGAYRDCVTTIKLADGTNFGPIIYTVAQLAAQTTGAERYFVLIIVCDSIVDDPAETVMAIRRAAEVAMSVIIVGVGNDFSAFETMEKLFNSNKTLKTNRTLVTFVQHKMFTLKQQGAFARACLDKLPDQVKEYFLLNKVSPSSAVPRPPGEEDDDSPDESSPESTPPATPASRAPGTPTRTPSTPTMQRPGSASGAPSARPGSATYQPIQTLIGPRGSVLYQPSRPASSPGLSRSNSTSGGSPSMSREPSADEPKRKYSEPNRSPSGSPLRSSGNFSRSMLDLRSEIENLEKNVRAKETMLANSERSKALQATLLKVLLPQLQKMSVKLNLEMPLGTLLATVCKKRQLDPRAHGFVKASTDLVPLPLDQTLGELQISDQIHLIELGPAARAKQAENEFVYDADPEQFDLRSSSSQDLLRSSFDLRSSQEQQQQQEPQQEVRDYSRFQRSYDPAVLAQQQLQQQQSEAVAATPPATPAAVSDESPLPEGWKEAKAPDGRTYYYQKATKKTQWKRPTAADAIPVTPPPAPAPAPAPAPVVSSSQEGSKSAWLKVQDAQIAELRWVEADNNAITIRVSETGAVERTVYIGDVLSVNPQRITAIIVEVGEDDTILLSAENKTERNLWLDFLRSALEQRPAK